METFTCFPFFQNIRGKKALVFGGGAVALRRVKSLLLFDLSINITARQVCPALKALDTERRVTWEERDYREGEIDPEAALALAATDERLTNKAIGEECRGKNIPVSVCDCKEESTFFFPALVKSGGGALIALSACGEDHRLLARTAAALREAAL